MGTFQKDLSSLFRPRSIAAVGASDRPGSRGAELLGNLRSIDYPGVVFPVNLGRETVFDLRCWPTLTSLPDVPEMVAIGVASGRVLEVTREAIAVGARAISVVGAGFAESGPEGAALQDEVAQLCREHDVLLCGPNCLGVYSRLDHVSYWLAEGNELPMTGLGLVIQSGALASSVMDPMQRRGVAFDVIATVGNEAVLTSGDYLGELAADPRIRAIAVVIEAIKDADRFLDALSDAVRQNKPVFVVKLGTSDVGRRAALAHTASLAGDDVVARAVLTQHGATLVSDLDALIEHLVLSRRYPDGLGRRVLFATVSGAGAGLVGDLATAQGRPPHPLGDRTAGELGELLPGVRVANPLDVAWAGDQPGVFADCMKVAASSDEVDALAVALNVSFATHPDGTRFYLEQVDAAGAFLATGKPTVLFTLTGGDLDPAIADAAARLGIPLLLGARPAVAAIVRTSAPWNGDRGAGTQPQHGPDGALPLPTAAGVLDEVESKRILASWGLRTAQEEVATTVGAAIAAAARIGYPVVVKGMSPGLLHKSELGAVRVGLTSADAVSAAYGDIGDRITSAGLSFDGVVVQASIIAAHELLIGAKRDDIFGPVIVLGWGGIFVEILRETSMRRAPIGRADAVTMVDELRGSEILRGARGQPAADTEALVEALLALSRLATATDSLEAVDINPLMLGVAGQGAVVVDASIVTRSTDG